LSPPKETGISRKKSLLSFLSTDRGDCPLPALLGCLAREPRFFSTFAIRLAVDDAADEEAEIRLIDAPGLNVRTKPSDRGGKRGGLACF